MAVSRKPTLRQSYACDETQKTLKGVKLKL